MSLTIRAKIVLTFGLLRMPTGPGWLSVWQRRTSSSRNRTEGPYTR